MCDDGISFCLACTGYFLDGLVSIEEKEQLKKINMVGSPQKCCKNSQLAQYSSPSGKELNVQYRNRQITQARVALESGQVVQTMDFPS